MYCLVAFVTLEVFTPTISILLYSPERKNEGGREGWKYSLNNSNLISRLLHPHVLAPHLHNTRRKTYPIVDHHLFLLTVKQKISSCALSCARVCLSTRVRAGGGAGGNA